MDARRLITLIAAMVAAVASAACGGAGDSVGADLEPAPPTTVLNDVAPDARFVALWDALTPFPDTEVPAVAPHITGVVGVDQRITVLAEGRGYRLQGVRVDEALHPGLTAAVDALVAEASVDGVTLRVASGFRTVERQREIFLAKLREACIEAFAADCSDEQLRDGAVDQLLDDILAVSAPPGYSSHHTGRIVDLGDDTIEFIEPGSPGYEWISADGFANAQRHGLAPRYPFGVSNMGPDPEPWEFFLTGTEVPTP